MSKLVVPRLFKPQDHLYRTKVVDQMDPRHVVTYHLPN